MTGGVRFQILIPAWFLLGLVRTVCADPLVALVVNGQPLQGRSVAHTTTWCWLGATDGSYQLVDLAEVSSFRRVADNFHPRSTSQLASDFKKELGKSVELHTRGLYVVCAPRGRAEAYAELFHEVSGQFSSYFNRKGWRLPAPDYPLVVMVLPDKERFDERCVLDGLTPTDELQGYYHPLSNRIWMHDGGAAAVQASQRGTTQTVELSRSTAIHEGIHQLAFNEGLHSRISANPRWVVEGLATMLEAGALEVRSGQESAARVNSSRLSRFREYSVRRRDYTIVEFLVSDEQQYRRAPLDFYSEAWALTFFLAETRRSDYVNYLRALAARDPADREYSAEDRVADFQKAFGKDLRRLEIQFVRYISELE